MAKFIIIALTLAIACAQVAYGIKCYTGAGFLKVKSDCTGSNACQKNDYGSATPGLRTCATVNNTMMMGCNKTSVAGIADAATICYCNDKDYCNGAINSGFSIVLTLAAVIAAAAAGTKYL